MKGKEIKNDTHIGDIISSQSDQTIEQGTSKPYTSRKIATRFALVTSDAAEFCSWLGMHLEKNKILLYQPQNYQHQPINKVSYLMEGTYPSVSNLQYLGAIATLHGCGIEVEMMNNQIKECARVLREARIQHLTGLYRLNLNCTTNLSLEEQLSTSGSDEIIAVSNCSESIFETNMHIPQSIEKILPKVQSLFMVF